MSWQKGQSGNPAGGSRPLSGGAAEQLRQLRGYARENAQDAIRVALELMQTGQEGTRIKAVELVLRWAYGDPSKVEADAQPVQATIASLTPPERIETLRTALEAELRKTRPS